MDYSEQDLSLVSRNGKGFVKMMFHLRECLKGVSKSASFERESSEQGRAFGEARKGWKLRQKMREFFCGSAHAEEEFKCRVERV